MRSKAVFEVNINSFKKNLKLIQKRCPQSNILLMIKANAYGHGAIDIAGYAVDNGIKSFGLATMQEAVPIRQSLDDTRINFYAFSETELDDLDLWKKNYLHLNIIPVIENLDELERILNDPDLSDLKIALKFNIGMNRFGLSSSEVEIACEKLKNHKRQIFHLMGHLPCSPDLKKLKKTQQQISLFNQIKKRIEGLGVKVLHSSVANSGAIERGLGIDHDFIRPGLIAYGPLSTKDNPMGWKGEMISSLKAKPLKVFPIQEGDLFGYGSTPSPANGYIAVIGLGYADGLTQNYASIEFRSGQQNGRVIGYVNMDISYILFEKPIEHGDWIEIWGSSPQAFAHIAKKTQVINYQLLCQISLRVPRLYKMS